MFTLAAPASPMRMPASQGQRRIAAIAAIANSTANASLCACAVTAQIIAGLTRVNSAARVCSSGLPPAILYAIRPIPSIGMRQNSWSQNTTSCMDVPPSRFASVWLADTIGPYTLGVSCHGCSVTDSSLSNWVRKISPTVISYGSRPSTCNRPYDAYIMTSALVSGGTSETATCSPTPSISSFFGTGRQPSPSARIRNHMPTAPTARQT